MNRKLSNIKRYVLYSVLIVVGVFVLYLFTVMVLNYTGYCFKQGRYLSDEEKIDTAINYILGTYPPAIDYYEKQGNKVVKVGRTRPRTPLYYESKDEFIALNTNCCELTMIARENYGIRLSSRLFGTVSTFVHVSYLVRYFDKDGSLRKRKIESYVPISNCGKAL